MGDDEYGAPFHQVIHTLLNDALGPGIDRRCRFIQDQHRRICNSRSRDSKQLSLSLREFFAVAAQMGVIAIRQHPDKSVCMCQFCSLYYFLIRCIQLTVTDILLDRSGKQMSILQNDAQGPSQVSLFDLIDIDIIIPDLTVRHIVETVDQVRDRRLSCSRRSHECQLLSRLRIERQVMQHHMVRCIAECHVIEANITFQLLISDRSVRLMRMLPCPKAGALLTLCQAAIFLPLRIDQGDISIVNLRLFIHHPENTLCSGKRHDDRVELLRDLHKRLCKALCKLQIRCHNAERDIADPCNRQEPSEYSCQHELHISDISDDRSHDTRKRMRSGGAFKQLLIQLVELFL